MTTDNSFAFMTEAADGKYDATKPTDEQLAAVLPWLVDRIVTQGRNGGYFVYANELLVGLFGQPVGPDGRVNKFYAADGRDCKNRDPGGFDMHGYDRNGYNKEGLNSDGYNKDGYNKDGYDYYGYNKDGFSKNGRDRNGRTREEVAAQLVASWSPEHVAMVAAKLAEQKAAKAAAEAAAAKEQELVEEEPVIVEKPVGAAA